MRVWPDGTSEYLGRPTYAPSYAEGTRDVVSARIGFAPPGGKPFDMEATLLLPVHLMVGTGYGLEQDWKHGMYQGGGSPAKAGITSRANRLIFSREPPKLTMTYSTPPARSAASLAAI